QTMNYYPVLAENQTNSHAGFQDTKKAEEEGTQIYVLFPVSSDGSTNPQNNNKDALVDGKEHDDDIQNTNDFSATGPSNAAMPNLEDLSHDADDVGAEADINNMESIISVSPIPTTKIYKDHLTSQIIGIEDPENPDKVYKVVKALYGLHQAPRACQDKYVAEHLRKFGLFEEKSASTPIDAKKPLLKDSDGKDVDVHTY
nr:ribonuclease H-like domain, reverse transcriptase, RNA-dependent DNA polymerase [Tanacetum cinerariifolium]